jgi:transcriptional regulator with XRE-family HTH domain
LREIILLLYYHYVEEVIMKPDVVGERIKRLRQDRGISQRQLAEMADLPQSQLSQIENGVRRGSTIQLDAARRIAFALHVSLDALAGVPTDDTESESLAAAVA